jgi:hypothetical protein
MIVSLLRLSNLPGNALGCIDIVFARRPRHYGRDVREVEEHDRGNILYYSLEYFLVAREVQNIAEYWKGAFSGAHNTELIVMLRCGADQRKAVMLGKILFVFTLVLKSIHKAIALFLIKITKKVGADLRMVRPANRLANVVVHCRGADEDIRVPVSVPVRVPQLQSIVYRRKVIVVGKRSLSPLIPRTCQQARFRLQFIVQ